MAGQKESLDGMTEKAGSLIADKGEKNLVVEDFVSDIDATDRLNFAKLVLLYLFILVITVFIASYIAVAAYPDNEKLSSLVSTILDVTKTAVPSIVTLVLGFYFGRKE